ncbi:hypothetical protein [Vibrio harveyi]|uniref:hypothetical protein n=3 Tax=Vibrio TaxID=662 RepID=UPI00066E0A3C|nr:hypothetical protein [Vibrio harveyi]EKO3809060.1 hypothetical protein [Vibrio harveyi]EKO3846807.1 hypothetical protein [Vibrio harveyi]EKY4195053.1 hypothetical protein [Vibrio harveyi]KNY42512.1 hypothetical protein AKG93_14175 [Vibrio harveyi]WVM82170.1 hypothetical protein V1M48_14640 [Vibrio harveyi]
MTKNIWFFVFFIMLIVISFTLFSFQKDKSSDRYESKKTLTFDKKIKIGSIENIENQNSIKMLRAELLKDSTVGNSLDIPSNSIDERITNLEKNISELSN